MREFLKNNNDFIEKQTINLLLFSAMAIPFYKPLIAPLFCLLTFISLFQLKKTFFQDMFYYKGLVLLICFYILHIIGLFYSKNTKDASFDLEVKLSFFIIPIVFISIKDILERNINKILLFFFFGTFFTSILYLFISLFQSLYFDTSGIVFNPETYSINEFYLGISNNFIYTGLSHFIHPSYFSMYVSFSIIIVLYFLHNGIISKIWIKYLMFFSFPFFFVIIQLLSSRAGIISSFLVLVFCLYLLMTKRINRFFKITILIISAAFMIIVMQNNNRMSLGLKQTMETKYDNNSNSLKTQNIRLLIWISTFEVIKNNFITGVGIGDTNDELLKVYKKNSIKDALLLNLNAHNQFLQTLIGLGFIGLLFLSLLLFIPFWYAIKKRDFLMIFFLILTGINFLFESMLNTQAGVVFFAFFYSLLMFKNPHLTTEKEKQNNIQLKFS